VINIISHANRNRGTPKNRCSYRRPGVSSVFLLVLMLKGPFPTLGDHAYDQFHRAGPSHHPQRTFRQAQHLYALALEILKEWLIIFAFHILQIRIFTSKHCREIKIFPVFTMLSLFSSIIYSLDNHEWVDCHFKIRH
jgi:hypothetical protein